MIDLDKQKETFIGLCKQHIHRDGLDDLLNWLETSDFYKAPASSRYHGSYEGGLCEHSIDVFNYALRVKELYDGEINMESLAITTLFHDVCKINMYKLEMRNKKVDGGWVEQPFYTIDERFHFGGHGSKSVYQVQYYMRLNPDEAAAINCHMGFAPGGDAVRDASNSFQQYPLAWIVHVADEAATFLLHRQPE